jgi:hypothetical protein
MKFSRALSVNAACADLIALDVFGREVTDGDDAGFRGSGGGALSGSELSHLREDVSTAMRKEYTIGDHT